MTFCQVKTASSQSTATTWTSTSVHSVAATKFGTRLMGAPTSRILTPSTAGYLEVLLLQGSRKHTKQRSCLTPIRELKKRYMNAGGRRCKFYLQYNQESALSTRWSVSSQRSPNHKILGMRYILIAEDTYSIGYNPTKSRNSCATDQIIIQRYAAGGLQES